MLTGQKAASLNAKNAELLAEVQRDHDKIGEEATLEMTLVHHLWMIVSGTVEKSNPTRVVAMELDWSMNIRRLVRRNAAFQFCLSMISCQVEESDPPVKGLFGRVGKVADISLVVHNLFI